MGAWLRLEMDGGLVGAGLWMKWERLGQWGGA